MLDPTQKWQYFEEQWTSVNPAWIPEYKAKVETFWKDYYQPKDADISSSSSQESQEELSNNLFVAHLQSKRAVRPTQDEYMRYISTPVVEERVQPLDWWLEKAQLQRYPHLSKMAIDLLSIPSSSANVERLFSSAKLTTTDRRNRLGINLIEALEQCKSWMDVKNWSEVELDD